MYKKLLLATVLLFQLAVLAQNRKGEFKLRGNQPHSLYVAFGAGVHLDPALPYNHQLIQQIPQLSDLLQQYPVDLAKGIAIDAEKLEQMQQAAIRISGSDKSVRNLRNILKVDFPDADNAKLLELATALERLPQVSYCELLSSEPVRPPGDIMPVTPNFLPQQTYIGPNPGVNMQFAWDLGLTGQGIRFRDVEYGFNKNHEEFHERAGAFLAPGMTVSSEATQEYTEHGTGVFGVVYADHGTYGVSGMAHGAQEMILYPEWQQSGYNRVNAVAQSIANSELGDIIIYEMQTYGQNDEFVPAEYSNAVWDLTKAATDAGITIVAAAGNGNQNLDASFYWSYRQRGNSGAIIVGGGVPNITHNKISYSTYGTRVDVQGWSDNVYSAGYGDLVVIGGDFNQRYTVFSGTSSATPIVASCAGVLQSYYHSLTGEYLTGQQLRDILKTTGIPQGTGGNIGPLPNMESALNAVSLLSVKNQDNRLAMAVYPNPAKSVLNIAGEFTATARIEIRNAVGQRVFNSAVPEQKSLDISGLAAGVYFVKVSDSGKTATKKIIKN